MFDDWHWSEFVLGLLLGGLYVSLITWVGAALVMKKLERKQAEYIRGIPLCPPHLCYCQTHREAGRGGIDTHETQEGTR